MKTIEVLGAGCPKCRQTVANAEQAIARLGIEAQVRKVEEIVEIAARGVMLTPALAVDGELRAVGRIPTVDEIVGYLSA
jgi:small redox-active disulfide protein 2